VVCRGRGRILHFVSGNRSAAAQGSWRSLVIVAIAAAVIVAQVSRLLESLSYLLPASAEGVSAEYFSLWFPRQLPCFIFGVMLFRFSVERLSIPTSLAKWTCALAIALMLLIPFLVGIRYALPLGLATTYGIAFSLFAISLMYWRNSPLVGFPIVWIGKISYSAYFVHFAVLHFLPLFRPTGWPVVDVASMYLAVVIVTAGISSLMYSMIERPMIRFGSAVIAARQPPKGPSLDLRPEGSATTP
jgi:peptidoglycan/LPS O-acetylase OafA/YrhL